jgi:carbamate kinase
MRPKVEAAIRFVRWKGREAVIGSLDRVPELLEGTGGTRIVPG